MHKKLKELEQKIGYRFRNFSFLEQAMMHSSYTNEHRMEKYRCNERLEFLGDAVLELISSEFLFRQSPKVPEGELTKTRASMVCEQSLAMCARDIDLGSYLLLGKGEEVTGCLLYTSCEKLMPNTPMTAVFDTAFHQTMPEKAYMYGLPYNYYEDYKIRRYGFHGTSHSFVSKKAAEVMEKPYEDVYKRQRLILQWRPRNIRLR